MKDSQTVKEYTLYLILLEYLHREDRKSFKNEWKQYSLTYQMGFIIGMSMIQILKGND